MPDIDVRHGRTYLKDRSAMTTIGMHYDVIPGKEEEFERGFLGVLEHLKTLPGHVESHMYEDVTSVGSYLILSKWDSKEQFEKFIHSPEFAKVVAWGKAEMLRARPRHKIYLDQ
ncbi:MAG TPA: antibiotic biosynthesis monooxygenase [Tepidisphaeraceae bacterium]|nr:antibiotic biosynthesis monooxygenase [Tepidisphaeraceae bacterium]